MKKVLVWFVGLIGFEEIRIRLLAIRAIAANSVNGPAVICDCDEAGRARKAKFFTRGGKVMTAKVVAVDGRKLLLRRGRGPIFCRQLIGIS